MLHRAASQATTVVAAFLHFRRADPLSAGPVGGDRVEVHHNPLVRRRAGGGGIAGLGDRGQLAVSAVLRAWSNSPIGLCVSANQEGVVGVDIPETLLKFLIHAARWSSDQEHKQVWLYGIP